MKIYDSGKVFAGLAIFLIVFLFPFWFNITSWGSGKAAPDPKTDTPVIEEMDEKHCVESKDWIKANHMILLDQWRTSVVRDADRTYVGYDGIRYEMSLSNTCMDCHSNKSQFCDQCHNYLAITPYCWDCHIEPKEPKESE